MRVCLVFTWSPCVYSLQLNERSSCCSQDRLSDYRSACRYFSRPTLPIRQMRFKFVDIFLYQYQVFHDRQFTSQYSRQTAHRSGVRHMAQSKPLSLNWLPKQRTNNGKQRPHETPVCSNVALVSLFPHCCLLSRSRVFLLSRCLVAYVINILAWCDSQHSPRLACLFQRPCERRYAFPAW